MLGGKQNIKETEKKEKTKVTKKGMIMNKELNNKRSGACDRTI